MAKTSPKRSFSKARGGSPCFIESWRHQASPFAIRDQRRVSRGAFELALACHYRVLADNDKTKVGLPEIKVACFPRRRTQRVARLLPTGDALQFCSRASKSKQGRQGGGSHMNSRPRARSLSAPAPGFLARQGHAAWDQKDFKAPSGRVFRPAA